MLRSRKHGHQSIETDRTDLTRNDPAFAPTGRLSTANQNRAVELGFPSSLAAPAGKSPNCSLQNRSRRRFDRAILTLHFVVLSYYWGGCRLQYTVPAIIDPRIFRENDMEVSSGSTSEFNDLLHQWRTRTLTVVLSVESLNRIACRCYVDSALGSSGRVGPNSVPRGSILGIGIARNSLVDGPPNSRNCRTSHGLSERSPCTVH